MQPMLMRFLFLVAIAFAASAAMKARATGLPQAGLPQVQAVCFDAAIAGATT